VFDLLEDFFDNAVLDWRHFALREDGLKFPIEQGKERLKQAA
jgi:hypothetical protein